MKKENKNKEKNSKEEIFTKRNIGMALIVLIAIILIVVAVIISSNSNNNNLEDEPKEEDEVEEIYSTEETVEDEYGFSKDDAINSVKEMFNSDNYSFDATLRNDNMYIVTVTNTETDDVYTFIVDPNDGSYSMELDEDE